MNQLIALFPSLVDLDCSSTFWRNDDPPTTARPQGLQSIALDSFHSLFFYHLLSRELHANHGVRALRFYDMQPEETEDVGKLLKTLGSSLEELNFGDLYTALGDNQCNAEAVFCKDINLAHNTHLRFFHLKIFHYYVNSLTWVITLLSQITSPYLVEMCLEFDVENHDDSLLKTIDWTQLVDVFNQQQWSNLQQLRVLHGVPEVWFSKRSAVDAFIKAQFSVLESRGILRLGS